MQLIDETGNTYNFLTVLTRIGSHPRYGAIWKCKCVCGTEVNRTGVDIRRGHFQSCGCKQGHNGGPKRTEENRVLNQHYSSYKNSKRAKELGFNLSKEDFEYFCQQECNYCGAKPQYRQIRYGSERNGPLYSTQFLSGLDRKDNTQGYTLTNVVACCSTCNHMKKNLTTQEFFTHVRRITKFNES